MTVDNYQIDCRSSSSTSGARTAAGKTPQLMRGRDGETPQLVKLTMCNHNLLRM
jgi:hypothetical protein